MKKTRSDEGLQFSASPMLALRLPMWRSKLVMFLIFIAFTALAVRAFWIQGPGNAFYIKQGEIRYQRTIELPASRGRILDRNGLVLAVSLPVRAIWAVPENVPAEQDADKLATMGTLLGISQKALHAKLTEDKHFVYIKRQVPIDVADKVHALDIPGIFQNREDKRFYPEGELTAHLVGFTNIEDEGQEGVELSMEKELEGTPGSRSVIEDRMGHIVEDVGAGVPRHDGQDIHLSIDSKIQYITYTALKAAVERDKAHAGGAIVVDTRTGDVLAMVSYPSYNPNDREDLTGDELRNRVLTDTFEPGSIMKPFSISEALDLHVITPTTIVNTSPGRVILDGATITDDGDYGVLTIGGVIQKSSNVGTTKISMQMKPEQLWDMFTSVGFGSAPKIGFPGTAAGILRPWQKWRRVEQATMSYGYGISVSLFQLAHAYTVFANNGRLLPLSIYKTTGTPPLGVQVFAPETVAEMDKILESVVGPGGTAPYAQVPGYRVGGKTGTAYYHGPHGYIRDEYRASFVGLAPMSNPRIIVAVSIDRPSAGSHFGGQVSGPVFSEIAGDTLRALNVAPDMPIKPMVVAYSPNAASGAAAQRVTAAVAHVQQPMTGGVR